MTEGLSKEELLDKIEQAAHNYERDYHGCSRCTLPPLQEYLNLGDDLTFKASIPLAGGVAFRGETCGALLGALLAIGLATGSEDITDEAALLRPMAAGFRFCRRFEKEMGTIFCRDILKAKLGRSFNLADSKEYEEAKKAGLYTECSKVVGKTSRLAAEFILKLREENKEAES